VTAACQSSLFYHTNCHRIPIMSAPPLTSSLSTTPRRWHYGPAWLSKRMLYSDHMKHISKNSAMLTWPRNLAHHFESPLLSAGYMSLAHNVLPVTTFFELHFCRWTVGLTSTIVPQMSRFWWNYVKYVTTFTPFNVVQGHQIRYQWKASTATSYFAPFQIGGL